jgi:hypothetical protein
MFSGNLKLGLVVLEISEDTVEVRDRRTLSVKADNQFSAREFASGKTDTVWAVPQSCLDLERVSSQKCYLTAASTVSPLPPSDALFSQYLHRHYLLCCTYPNRLLTQNATTVSPLSTTNRRSC